MSKSNSTGIAKIFIALALLAAIGAAVVLYFATLSISLKKDTEVFFISTGEDYPSIAQRLNEQGGVGNAWAFDLFAKAKKYPSLVKPGKYQLVDGMTYLELINRLRIGEQMPIKLQFKSVRLKTQLAQRLSEQLEFDSIAAMQMLNNESLAAKYGFNSITFITLFIPNTYEMYWTTTPKEFVERMAVEYKSFWSTERKQEAKKLGLSQSEVAALASIVQEETAKPDEMPSVAGVYWNRLQRGMLLQADPTLRFALGDFTIKRILNVHKKIQSSYNTYIYKGLPPGPILLPSITAIDAVLNLKKHNYLYFCANPDFSGYHSFAKNYTEHLRNARAYQRELNKRRIYK